MSRRLPTFRNTIHFSREKAGMAFAIAAVACLSSVIVQWSRHSPVAEDVWEHPLFGDLAEEDSTWEQSLPSIPDSETDVGPVYKPAEEPAPFPHTEAMRIVSSTRSDSIESPFVTFARFMEPEEGESSPIRVVAQQVPAIGGAVWLSGGIEEGTSEQTNALPPSTGVVELNVTTSEE